ncbi:hypothetical protein, partial [Methylobacterium nigriterrae]|uniref:hypothetical protein n=1 Tax=Methylobacterium nigriterrae TaxID=3127512 RepID=UPI003013EB79
MDAEPGRGRRTDPGARRWPALGRLDQEGSMLRLRRVKATDRVLLIICLMYLITYIDRVNIGTAAPVMQKELG